MADCINISDRPLTSGQAIKDAVQVALQSGLGMERGAAAEMLEDGRVCSSELCLFRDKIKLFTSVRHFAKSPAAALFGEDFLYKNRWKNEDGDEMSAPFDPGFFEKFHRETIAAAARVRGDNDKIDTEKDIQEFIRLSALFTSGQLRQKKEFLKEAMKSVARGLIPEFSEKPDKTKNYFTVNVSDNGPKLVTVEGMAVVPEDPDVFNDLFFRDFTTECARVTGFVDVKETKIIEAGRDKKVVITRIDVPFASDKHACLEVIRTVSDGITTITIGLTDETRYGLEPIEDRPNALETVIRVKKLSNGSVELYVRASMDLDTWHPRWALRSGVAKEVRRAIVKSMEYIIRRHWENVVSGKYYE